MQARNAAFRLAATLTVGIASTVAHDCDATAQRTFVSSTGTDANPCSLLQPCRSFAAAIVQTTTDGEIIVLDSAGYGPVVITKGVSLIAPEGVYAGISVAAGDGIGINAPGATVVLRGLSVNGVGGGFGIHLQAAARLRIERCVISNMGSNGVHVSSAGAETTIVDSIVRANGSGIAVTVDGALILDRVRSEQNGGHGLALSVPSNHPPLTVSISNSALSANGLDGINSAPGGNSEIRAQIDRAVVSHNAGNGVNGMGSATGSLSKITIAHSAINNNQGHGLTASTVSGSAFVFLSETGFESNVGNAVRSDGTTAIVSALATTAQSGGVSAAWSCSNGGLLKSLGNNVVTGIAESSPGCYTTIAGQ